MEILILSILLIFSLLWAFASMGLVGFGEKRIELPDNFPVIVGTWNDVLDNRLQTFARNDRKICYRTRWDYLDSVRRNGIKYKTRIYLQVGSWFGDPTHGSLLIGITSDAARKLLESKRIGEHVVSEDEISTKDILIPRSNELFSSKGFKDLEAKFKNPQERGTESLDTTPMSIKANIYPQICDRMKFYLRMYSNRENWEELFPEPDAPEVTGEKPPFKDEEEFLKLRDSPEIKKMLEYYKLIGSIRDGDLRIFLTSFWGDLIKIEPGQPTNEGQHTFPELVEEKDL
jgi:hypothetical protein